MKPKKDKQTVPQLVNKIVAFVEISITPIVTDIINYWYFKKVFLANLKLSKDQQKKIRCIKILSGAKSLLVGYIATLLARLSVDIGKKTVGALRPTFLENCFGSRQGYIDFCKEAIKKAGSNAMAVYIVDHKCPKNAEKVESDRMSFPSGWWKSFYCLFRVQKKNFAYRFASFAYRNGKKSGKQFGVKKSKV